MAIEIRADSESPWTEVDADVAGDQSSIEIDGTTVYVPVEYIDDFSHEDLASHYSIADTGQATLPSATTAAAHRTESHGLHIPFDNPNSLISLPSDHAEYDETEQPSEVENYPSVTSGDVVECYLKPVDFPDTGQIRFAFATTQYGQQECLRVRLTGQGYWRVEEATGGTWNYWGDPKDDNFSWNDRTHLHRAVFSFTRWPDVDIYLYDIDGGTSQLISSLSTNNGPGGYGDRGFGWWWNGDVEAEISGLKLIDESDI